MFWSKKENNIKKNFITFLVFFFFKLHSLISTANNSFFSITKWKKKRFSISTRNFIFFHIFETRSQLTALKEKRRRKNNFNKMVTKRLIDERRREEVRGRKKKEKKRSKTFSIISLFSIPYSIEKHSIANLP